MVADVVAGGVQNGVTMVVSTLVVEMPDGGGSRWWRMWLQVVAEMVAGGGDFTDDGLKLIVFGFITKTRPAQLVGEGMCVRKVAGSSPRANLLFINRFLKK